MLSNLPGNATIVRGGHVKEKINLDDLLQGSSTQNTVNPIFDKGFFQTPTSTMQRTVEAQKSVGFHPPYEAPSSFRGLFLQDSDASVRERKMVIRQSSLPSRAAFEAIQNTFDGSVPSQRGYPPEVRESEAMVAHPGIGAASYINSMNKDRRRKFSAPVLCAPYEAAVRDCVDAGSISSNDSVGLVLKENDRERSTSLNHSGIFHFQKATAVSLDPMSPTIKTEKSGSSFNVNNKAVGGSPSLKHRKLRYNRSAEFDAGIRKNSERRFDVELRDLSLKPSILTEKDDILTGEQSPVLATEQRKATSKKFAVTKTESKSRLLGESPENGSNDSLSRVVGKLKDKEVFL